MIFISLTIALFSLQAAPPQETDAEKLFKKMEERLAATKTLQFEVNATSDRSALDTTEAKVFLANENRLRIEYAMHKGDPGDRFLIVSNGKSMKQTRLDQSWGPWDVGPDLNAVAKIGISRAGGAAFLLYYQMKSKEAAIKSQPVSGFKSEGKEKIGTVEAEIVSYSLELPERGKLAVKIWIDPVRLVPLRRTTTGEFKETKVTLTSNYDAFKIDEPIDEEKFNLP